MLALYGSWLLATPRALLADLRQHRRNGLLALALGVAFVGLVVSYRNYPAIVARGIERETHNAAGMRAYAAGDYDTAVQELQAAAEMMPTFTETRANLAMVYAAQERYDAAWQVLDSTDSQRMNLVRGALERAQGDEQAAQVYFTDAETRAGEDIQRFALEWLPAPPTTYVELGGGTDLGYVAGFSPAEEMPQANGADVSYRWLQGRGQVVLPLPEPLEAGSVVTLRLTSGQSASVPLMVQFGDDPHTDTISVSSGVWRLYRVAVPASLEGQQELALTLDAPIFIPAHQYADSVDTRPLSLMVSAVWVE
jgi:tetratricopeptide (TPR) repeat protein